MARNLQLFNQNISNTKQGLAEVGFCWAAGILYGVETSSIPLRVTECFSRCFDVNMSDFYIQSAHCHTLELYL